MILDVHAYVGKWPYWPVEASTPQQVVQALDAAGIDRAAICSTRSHFVNWADGNEEALRAVEQFPQRLIGFACLGPLEVSHQRLRPDLDLERFRGRGFLGFRLYPQHHSYHPLYEQFIDRACEHAAAHEQPILLPLRVMMNWGVPAMALDWMVALVERHPRTPWILAGLNYFHELRAGISLLLRYPSVHLETSCVQGFNAIAKLVEECGSRQLLFGSGTPLQHARAGVEKILNARIRDTDREQILYKNACRLLRLNL